MNNEQKDTIQKRQYNKKEVEQTMEQNTKSFVFPEEQLMQQAPVEPQLTPKQLFYKQLAKEAAEESVMVRGRFKFHECPNGINKFGFRKYPNVPTKTYTMKHDEIYTVPLMVARHLNNECAYQVYGYTEGKAQVSGKVHRFSFESLEFTDQVKLSAI